jgi:hypothetical protein
LKAGEEASCQASDAEKERERETGGCREPARYIKRERGRERARAPERESERESARERTREREREKERERERERQSGKHMASQISWARIPFYPEVDVSVAQTQHVNFRICT